ncbi:hypothetical protein M3J09_003796 [Ascochyta lentis]
MTVNLERLHVDIQVLICFLQTHLNGAQIGRSAYDSHPNSGQRRQGHCLARRTAVVGYESVIVKQ